MKKYLTFILTFLMIFQVSAKEIEFDWGKTLGGSDFDSFSSVTETKDGGFVAVGRFPQSRRLARERQRYCAFILKYSYVFDIEKMSSENGTFELDKIKGKSGESVNASVVIVETISLVI